MRRMVRQRVMRYGQPILAAVQTTNLYSFHGPGARAAHLPVPPARPAPFSPQRGCLPQPTHGRLWRGGPDLGYDDPAHG
jgi:hypothetical protein